MRIILYYSIILLSALFHFTMRFHCEICKAQFHEDKAEKNNMRNTGYKCMRTFPCRYCGCELIGDEAHGSCCNKGKTPEILRRKRPNFFDVIDDVLLPLYTTNNYEFENNTRKYNNLFFFRQWAQRVLVGLTPTTAIALTVAMCV